MSNLHNSLLVDSHVFIWLLYESKKVNAVVREAILTADSVFVSRASLIELTFKHGTGRLLYSPSEFLLGVESLGLQIIEITDEHLAHYQNVKLKHRDPFDRLLITQSQVEELAFVTADRNILSTLSITTLDATIAI